MFCEKKYNFLVWWFFSQDMNKSKLIVKLVKTARVQRVVLVGVPASLVPYFWVWPSKRFTRKSRGTPGAQVERLANCRENCQSWTDCFSPCSRKNFTLYARKISTNLFIKMCARFKLKSIAMRDAGTMTYTTHCTLEAFTNFTIILVVFTTWKWIY